MIAAAGSTLLTSSTASATIISEPAAPPYSSGTSIPMSPISKYCRTSAGSMRPARSISSTRGFTSEAANDATASRKAISSSDSSVSAGRVPVVLSAIELLVRGKSVRCFFPQRRRGLVFRMTAACVATGVARPRRVPAARRLLRRHREHDSATRAPKDHLGELLVDAERARHPDREIGERLRGLPDDAWNVPRGVLARRE